MQMSSLTYLVIFLKINILAVHRAQEEDNMLIFNKVMADSNMLVVLEKKHTIGCYGNPLEISKKKSRFFVKRFFVLV